jgi:hypothetical protein
MPSSRRKAVLVVLAHLGVQPRVVGQGVDARVAQRGGQLFHALARLAIHHARLARVLALDEAQQLRGGVLLLDDGVADVGPVKAADEQARVCSCSRSMMSARVRASAVAVSAMRGTPGIALVQHRQRAVLGAEVVAPLAHAMRFVDGKQAQVARCWYRLSSRPRKRGVFSRSGAAYSSVIAGLQAQLHVLRLASKVERGVEETPHPPPPRAARPPGRASARSAARPRWSRPCPCAGARWPAPGSTGSCRRRWA